MTIKEIRASTGLNRVEFSNKYRIPVETLRHWERGDRKCPDYVMELLEFMVKEGMKMEELKMYLENEIKKTEELLKNEEQKKIENYSNPMFNNDTSVTCIVSMLLAYRNVLDYINGKT